MAEILPFPSRSRPRPVDDGTVTGAAACLADHYDRMQRSRADHAAELREWNATVDAAAAAYRARRSDDGPEAA